MSLNNAEAIAEWRRVHPNERLVLSSADLSGADLNGANLSNANLGEANLLSAYLGGANLSNANLGGANLGGAYLGGANLRGAYLDGANLGGANLGGANLSSADLREADLRGANLRRANLRGAYLDGANLGGVDLRGGYLGGARILQLGPIGSRQDYVVWKHGPELDEVMTGCFRGTLAQFEDAVQQKHGDNVFGQEYRAAIAFIKQLRHESTDSRGLNGCVASSDPVWNTTLTQGAVKNERQKTQGP